MIYKVFNDLKFFDAPMPFMLLTAQIREYCAKPTRRAYINFDNGWTVSVITGYRTMAEQQGTYELATLYKDELHLNNSICKNYTPIAPLTAEEVSKLMIEIQDFQPLSEDSYKKLIADNNKMKKESEPFFW